jgi:hypothetical protein
VKANGLVFSNALIGRSDLAWETSRTSRVMAAVLRMNKLDIAELKRAYDGGAV